MLARDSLKIVEYLRSIKSQGFRLIIHTNGSARNEEYWTTLACLDAEVHFALDGLSDTHAQYRRGTNFDTIIRNAQAFIAAGGSATWKMIPFEYNMHQIEDCRQMSKELGFSDFLLFERGRNQGPVYGKDGRYLYNLDEDKKGAKFKTAQEHIEYWKKTTREDSYFLKPAEQIQCRSKQTKEIYITAEGEVYPCCYMGFSPRKDTRNIGANQVRALIENFDNNAKHRSVQECIQWFNQIEKTWNLDTYDQGRMFICDMSCGVKQRADLRNLL